MADQTKRNRPVSLATSGRRRVSTRTKYIKVPFVGYMAEREVRLCVAALGIFIAAYILGTFGLYAIFDMTGRL